MGTILNVEVKLKPFSIYDKIYAIALIKDVTSYKEIEIDLMLKSKALQSASNGILITDALQPDNPIIFYNEAFQLLTGYSDKEILHKNCRFLQGDDINQRSLNKLRKAIKEGKSCQALLRNYKRDGTMFWNDLYISPIKNNKGVVTNFIGVQNDVTKRMRYEEERNHLAKIFDESLNEIYVFESKTLNFLNANIGAQKNIGYTIEELKKMTFLDIKPDNEVQDFKRHIDLLLKPHVEKVEYETIHQRKDGTTYPVDVHLQLSELGEKSVVVAIISDITDRKNYTNKLERTVAERTDQLLIALNKQKELNELKTKFLALVSHEFKTPLSGILTSTMLLKKYTKEKDQKKREKHLATISEKVHYLNSILTDFLTIENLETGSFNYNFNQFKLSKVIDEVVYNANMIMTPAQHIKYPDHIDHINLYQDEKIVELVLSNVLNNAIKYSPKNSTVELYVTEDGESVTIEVKDKGIGIPKHDQVKIFERYFRAENVLNIKGTGIGLNIVKTHLANLGGTISFKSEENQGSTFTICLPKTIDK